MKKESLTPEGPGVRLRQARERAGLTVTNIADTLFLSENAITGIEADDYSQFAGVMFAKGYIRNYAREVGLNGDELIRSFDKLGLVDNNMTVADSSYQPETLSRNENYMRWGALVVASVILLIVFIAWSVKHRPSPVISKSLSEVVAEKATTTAAAFTPDIRSMTETAATVQPKSLKPQAQFEKTTSAEE